MGAALQMTARHFTEQRELSQGPCAPPPMQSALLSETKANEVLCLLRNERVLAISQAKGCFGKREEIPTRGFRKSVASELGFEG